jgi:tetratricopeptide (TPR) repeat protein
VSADTHPYILFFSAIEVIGGAKLCDLGGKACERITEGQPGCPDAVRPLIVQRGGLMKRELTTGALLLAFVLTVQMSSVPPVLADTLDDCEHGNDVDRVIQACTDIISEKGNPKLPSAYSNRCSAYTQKHDTEQAILDCDKAIELDPQSAEPYESRCWTYIDKGEYDRGITDCDKAILLDPKFARAYRSRCQGFIYKGEYDRATPDCERAIEFKPDAKSFEFSLLGTCRHWQTPGSTSRLSGVIEAPAWGCLRAR